MKKIVQRMQLIVTMIALIAMVAVCARPSSFANAASKPTISKKTLNILVDEKYNLNINNKIAKSTYKWTSSDKDIATVDSRGIVTAKSKGEVRISCLITTPDKNEHRVTCTVTVREPAKTFKISNKVSALNLGQKYDLNRKLGPSSSNDKTTWTSSDETIAKPDSKGKFVALKEGTVTITGKTLSGKSDSVTITVVDKEGTVTNQSELDKLVGSGAQLVTVKTDKEIELKIKKGKYTNQTLIVDAPNADIINRGTFKTIEIKQVKGNTWYERAVGNLLKILDDDVSIVISSDASVSIEVNEDKAVLRIENNGKIEEIILNKEATLDISGDSNETTAVTVNVPNVKIKTSVPLNLISNAKFELEILPSAEKTTVKAANKDVVPTVKGNVDIKVEIDGQEETVPGTPTTPSTGGGGGGGGGYTPEPTPTPPLRPGEYRLEKELNQVASVKVEIDIIDFEYTINTDMLNTLIEFLSNESVTITKWEGTTDTEKTYGGIGVRVTGVAGELSKTVAFTCGPLNGKSFNVTVDPSDSSVTVAGNSLSYKIKMLNSKSIQITPEPGTPDLSFIGLDFDFTYK